MKPALFISLSVAALAFYLSGRETLLGEVGRSFDGITLPTPQIPLTSPQIAATVPNSPILFRPYAGKAQLTASDARILISDIDNSYFGGWFAANVDSSDIIGIWKTESGLRPAEINDQDPFGGAWGIGQVLADVARIDYGISPPALLLEVETGARVSMQHIQSTIQRLIASGVNPTFSAWAQAYNVGVAGYVSGRRNLGYLALVTARRIV